MTRTAARVRRPRRRRGRDDGFTLIELLVVVIIIGVLAAVAIPVYIGVQNSAKDRSAVSDLTNARQAYLAYVTATGRAPTASTLATDLAGYGFTASRYTAGAAPTLISGTTTALCLTATSDLGTRYYIRAATAASTTVCT